MAVSLRSTSQNRAFSTDPALIRISNLRLRTYIGFNPEEIEKKQDVIINASISYDCSLASHTDQQQDALNYKTITKAIIAHVEENSFHLLEKLTADLIAIAMENTEVLKASFTVDKPNALRFADSVSLTLNATRT